MILPNMGIGKHRVTVPPDVVHIDLKRNHQTRPTNTHRHKCPRKTLRMPLARPSPLLSVAHGHSSSRRKSMFSQLVGSWVAIIDSVAIVYCLTPPFLMIRIASFSGDLSSMTAPPFILSPVSLTEYPCEFPARVLCKIQAPDGTFSCLIIRWM